MIPLIPSLAVSRHRHEEQYEPLNIQILGSYKEETVTNLKFDQIKNLFVFKVFVEEDVRARVFLQPAGSYAGGPSESLKRWQEWGKKHVRQNQQHQVLL